MAAVEADLTGYWLACRVATHVCALPLAGIVETMRPLPLETFPRAPAFVAGIAIIRAVPTAVVDMRKLMGQPEGTFNRFVTVKISERVVALGFDDVLGVHGLSHQRAIELPPLLHSAAGDAVTYVSAKDRELLLFLESSRIFPPGLIESLDQEKASA